VIARRRSLGALIGAILLDVSATLPIGLLGVLAVSFVAKLGISEGQMATIVATFFLAGAVVALASARFLDALGWRRSLWIATAMSVSSPLVVAADSGSRAIVTAAMLVGGAGLAIMIPATNLALTRTTPVESLAVMVTLKQASIPIALLASGALAPSLALAASVEWPFLLAALVGPVGLLLLQIARCGCGDQPAVVDVGDDVRGRRRDLQGLATLGVATGIASLLPGALTGMLALSLAASGTSATQAGVIYGVANAAGIAVRLLSGLYAHRTGTDGFLPVITLMAVGGIGAMLLGLDSVLLLLVGAVIAFGLGWGWPGLLFFAAMRAVPTSPAAASAVVQSGGMMGAALGPVMLGAIVTQSGWVIGWLSVGAMSVLAAVGVGVARTFLVADAAG